MYDPKQLDLFSDQSVNPTSEIKRQIRLAMSGYTRSRDQILDMMNEIAGRDGVKGKISKNTLDSWCKDSDFSRLPTLPWLVIFCKAMNTAAPIYPMLRPLGRLIIGGEDVHLLAWARAEKEKRQAAKRARLALESME